MENDIPEIILVTAKEILIKALEVRPTRFGLTSDYPSEALGNHFVTLVSTICEGFQAIKSNQPLPVVISPGGQEKG
jgi:hypothetical protein